MKKIVNPWIELTDKGYNCFACAPSNPYGLKMEFYEDGDDIVSFWTPDVNYQGWLDTLHGGIQATLLDEIGGWIVGRKLQTSGMTTNLNIKYRKPVPCNKDATIEIRGRIKNRRLCGGFFRFLKSVHPVCLVVIDQEGDAAAGPGDGICPGYSGQIGRASCRERV